eukprot:6257382-Amphidinium_carterae.1
MALNVSHQSSVSCSGGTGADYGLCAPTLDAISARFRPPSKLTWNKKTTRLWKNLLAASD